jgi:hypothetical protein
MKEVPDYSNKGTSPLQRGDNHKNVKMGWGHLKISRTTWSILTRHGTIILEMNDSIFGQIKGIAPLQGEVIAKSENTMKIFKNFLLQNQQAKIN